MDVGVGGAGEERQGPDAVGTSIDWERGGHFVHFSWSGPHVRASKWWKPNRRRMEWCGGQESLASWY